MKTRHVKLRNRELPAKFKEACRPMDRDMLRVKRAILRKLGTRLAAFRPVEHELPHRKD